MMHLSRRHFLQSSAAAASAALAFQPRWLRADERPAGKQPPGKDLLVRQAEPFNAEPALAALAASAITPVEHFYVRSHGAVPKLSADGYKLQIEGLVHKPRQFTLPELRSLAGQQEQEATLTCAGNRRLEMSRIKPVSGVQWDAGAIGHATWAGALLATVLEMAEVKAGAKHVWFEGLDPIKEKDGSVAPFGGSIPLDRALAKESPVLLAHGMNGQPLTAEHGFPVRTLVPGYIGARSVKWLGKIVVSDRPSPNHYLAEAYKVIRSEDKSEVASAEPIYEFPINAAICTPAAGNKVAAGKVTIAGYALPTGGARVAKVELSTDGGKSWQTVPLSDRAGGESHWRLWKIAVDLAAGKHDLIVRATDSAGHRQPAEMEWNLKGYLFNAWHRVGIEVT